MYYIKEAAQLSGVSVKTLHHYDKLGLLSPLKSENGYRLYSEADLERLQIILFYKYLGFPLKEIAELLAQEGQDLLPHLLRQLQSLEQEKERLDILISTLRKTIQAQKGERKITTEEKFAGFTYEAHRSYHDQAVEKYGQAVVDEAIGRQAGQEEQVTAAFNRIFRNLANNLQQGLPAAAETNQEQAAQLLQTIRRYSFDCSLEIFAQIGRGYAANPEFKENIDQFGAGTARYTADVIAVYVQKQGE
ncbi:MerR family transcriptional regulator [Streptococcus panodentis]|uniref:MerR family transcriptional regulator n=1 Tax=Streptococcus panodentis TaxID=1581472 RepID=A0ABS5AVQ1_9STRE|nr:MerR family transcriptional regulator [Streptococcus panodentis]MBP2620630.1 MerR family transcriptional regulator [Streptococcus panodentis]